MTFSYVFREVHSENEAIYHMLDMPCGKDSPFECLPWLSETYTQMHACYIEAVFLLLYRLGLD